MFTKRLQIRPVTRNKETQHDIKDLSKLAKLSSRLRTIESRHNNTDTSEVASLSSPSGTIEAQSDIKDISEVALSTPLRGDGSSDSEFIVNGDKDDELYMYIKEEPEASDDGEVCDKEVQYRAVPLYRVQARL